MTLLSTCFWNNFSYHNFLCQEHRFRSLSTPWNMGFVCQEHGFRSLGTPWHMGFPVMGFLVGFAGNILNFNVGAGVDLSIPRSFWSRLAGKYGNLFYWQEKVMQKSFFAAKNSIILSFYLLLSYRSWRSLIHEHLKLTNTHTSMRTNDQCKLHNNSDDISCFAQWRFFFWRTLTQNVESLWLIPCMVSSAENVCCCFE